MLTIITLPQNITGWVALASLLNLRPVYVFLTTEVLKDEVVYRNSYFVGNYPFNTEDL